MAQIQITVSTYDHAGRVVKIAGLVGAADSSNVAEVDTAILALFAETDGPLDFILDATDLEYINSTFIGHLTDWYSRLAERDGKVLLVNLKPNVEDTLATVGLLGLISHYGNLAEAKLALTEHTQETAQPENHSLTV